METLYIEQAIHFTASNAIYLGAASWGYFKKRNRGFLMVAPNYDFKTFQLSNLKYYDLSTLQNYENIEVQIIDINFTDSENSETPSFNKLYSSFSEIIFSYDPENSFVLVIDFSLVLNSPQYLGFSYRATPKNNY